MRMFSKPTRISFVLAGLLMVGCGVAREKYNTDVANLDAQLKSLTSNNQDIHKQNGLLQQELSECQLERADCERRLLATRTQGDAELTRALERIRQLEMIAAKQQAMFDKLRTALDSLVRAGKLTVSIVRGQFTVQMSDKILFDSGKFAIKTDAEETLKMVTDVLRSVPGRRWQVAGHTDTDGPPDYNWKLSSNRAWAVSKFMISQGMPQEGLSFAGYGEVAPTAPNDTKESKALNRRIEIVLSPDLEALLGPLSTKPKQPPAPAPLPKATP